MGNFAARRLAGLLPILFGVSIVVFLVMRMLPGDVASMILSGDRDGAAADPAAVAALRDQLGLNDPLWRQYLAWVGNMLMLDAGNSLWSGKPVLAEIAQRIPLTVELALLALAMSLVAGLAIGIICAVRQDSWLDLALRTVSVAGLTIPSFWLGTLVILGLATFFRWVPPLGYVSLWQDPLVNLQQLFWPALVIAFGNAAIIARMTRSSVVEVLREDYIRTARAKGLGGRAVLVTHALRNALLPVLTIAAIEFGSLLSGAVVMETIFTLPGLGRYLIDAIFHRDYPVVQAVVLLLGLLFALLNLTVDLLYGLIDPRIRHR